MRIRHVLLALILFASAMLAIAPKPTVANTTQTTIDQAAGRIQEVSYTLPDTGAHALAVNSGCKRVKLIAPVNSSGAGTNAAPIFYGDGTNQHDWIAADGSRDTYLHVDDTSKIYVKGSANDVIWYRVEW